MTGATTTAESQTQRLIAAIEGADRSVAVGEFVRRLRANSSPGDGPARPAAAVRWWPARGARRSSGDRGRW